MHTLLKDEELQPNDLMVSSAKAMFDELRRVSEALRPLRSIELQ